MTKRLIVLQPDWSHISSDTQLQLIQSGELARLGAGADYSDNPLPSVGDRPIHDHKQEPEAVDPRFPKANTHHRPAPWIITSEGQCYSADMPDAQDFDEVWVFKCGWQPMPEEENPWMPAKRLEVQEAITA